MMAVTKEDIEAEARRVWPNAKTIYVRHGSPELIDLGENAWRVDASDYSDKPIGGCAAESIEALKAKLEGIQPDGGQAP